MKKTALILFCASFLFFGLTAKAQAATYYVDNCDVTGNDINNGTAVSTPWLTINKVNTSSFVAGDSISFREGCTWREQLTVPSSGTSGSPITFGSYGATGAKPIISGSDLVTSWTAAYGGDTGGIFIANAETNNTSQFTGVTTGGTATFAAGAVANGSTYGYTATADGTNSALGYKTITPQANIYVRLYFRVKSGYSLNEGQDQVLLAIEDGSGTEQVIRVGIRKSSGVLTMFMADRIFYSFYSTGELVTTDVWHSLLVRYVASASGGAQAWLDGVSIGSNFTLDMSSHPADTVRVGINSNSDAKLGNGSIVYFDDIKADTATIGAVPNAPTNTYSSPVTTVPRAVWQENSAQLTKETVITNIVAGSWYHDATAHLLYANMTDGSNPTTKTVEAASRNNAVVITDKSYVTIDGLQAEKTNDTNKGAIWARTSTGTNTTNVTVQNSTVAFGMSGIMFQSVDNAVAYNNTVYGELSTDLSGIYTEQLAAAHFMQSPSITYNTLHDLEFCTIQPITGVTINSVNGTWGHNTCYNTANYGLQFNLATSPTIEYNLVHDGGTPTQDTHGIHWADTTGAIVRYNVVYNWRDPQNWSGGGYQADNNSDNSVIYGNIAYGNDGCGFSVLNSSGVLVYNNVAYGNNQHQNFAEFCVQSPDNVGLNKASATLKNNIGFATKSGTYAVFVDARSEAHTQVIDTNLWYISSGNWWYHGGEASGVNLTGGTAGNSLATWNAVSYVSTDLNSNPFLTNTAGNDFFLLSTSPAIDSGTSLGDTYKLGLNPNSVWPSAVNTLDQTLNGSGWEMGAYVYSQSSAPTVSISAPSAGTVSGSITISATAGATSPATVSSVQYKIDGVNVGSPVTTPYDYTWDSTSVTDGTHSITALALDNYGNTTTSDPVSVTVHNAVASGGGGRLITYIPPASTPSTICPVGNLFSVTTGLPCTGNVSSPPSVGGVPVVNGGGGSYNFGTTTLKFWSKGEAVKELQRFLNQDLKLNLKVDGVLGMKTITIVRQWQKAHGLVADGLVGKQTKAKMLGAL